MDNPSPLEEKLCPCGSGRVEKLCCGPYLSGEQIPATAQALMRSRYCAYVRHDVDYLLTSWHPSTRPQQLSLEGSPDYIKLEIVDAERGAATDDEGWVEFRACFRTTTGESALHERSRFLRYEGRWCYVDGVFPDKAVKVGRNAPCPCGSGKKYKRCCG